MLQKLEGRYKKILQNPNYGPKKAQIRLKWSPEDTLGDPWFLQTFCFSKLGCRGRQFLNNGRKQPSKKWHPGRKKPSKTQTIGQKGTNIP